MGITRETVLRRVESIGYTPTKSSKYAPRKGQKNDASEVVGDQPPKTLASKVAGWSSEGGFSPGIYNSSRTPQNRGFSEVVAATSESVSDDQDGPFETPIPESRYTLAELRRAVRHCIGDDGDEAEE